MEKVRILVDLDETLADFIGGACRVYGVSRQELEQYWEPGTWNIVAPMGYALAHNLEIGDGFGWGESAFWATIAMFGERFWLDLEPLPWAKELVNVVESFSDDWYVVSAPSRSAESYSGKARWLKAFFGNRFDRFALTAHKHLLANPNTILIDDREENIAKFRAAGGIGIPFPCRHNSYYEVSDPMSHIQAVLELICV